MSLGPITLRLLGVSCALALLAAVHGCGGGEEGNEIALEDAS